MIIKNGLIHNAVEKEPFVADILIKDGKIAAIGKDLKPDGEVIDATGKEIYPGLVEAHCHIGIASRFGEPSGNSDCNEKSDATTPQVRGIDAVDPADEAFNIARRAGVTCVCTGPGSANAVGGTFVALKTYGIRVDKMVVKDNIAMKCAFGENVKKFHGGKNVATRLANASVIRDLLKKAERYKEQVDAAEGDVSKLPSFDAKLDAMLPVMRGEMPLKAHAHQANDIFTAIRIAKEFGVKLTLEHVTDGSLIADELAEEKYYLAVGPSMMTASKYELRNKTWETPGKLAKAGCHVCIITDSPVISQENLPHCAGFAVKARMDPFEALKAITINAAEHIGIADRVGSIEVGKDADILITNGNPMEISTVIEKVIIDGKIM